MEEKDLILSVAETVLGLDKSKAEAELYNADGKLKDDAATVIANTNKERVAKFKAEQTAKFDDGYKKAQKEVLTDFESKLKEKHGLKTEKSGLELIDELIGKSRTDYKVTDDDVKKHALYIEAESKLKNLPVLEGKVKEFEQKLTEVEMEKRFAVVLSEANVIFDEMKPILPTNEVAAKNQRRVFEQAIKAIKYEIQKMQSGKTDIVLLAEDGKTRLEDEHGNRIKFGDKVKEIVSSLYDLPASDDKSSAGDPNKRKKQTDGKEFNLTKPKSDQEYIKMLSDIEAEGLSPKEYSEKVAALKKLYRG